MIEGTVIEYVTKRRKHSKSETIKLLIERDDKGSMIVTVPFSYTYFPALIYYNKTIIIGQKINLECDIDPDTSQEVDIRLLPWEEQEINIKENIYRLFFEAMSELYFSKDKHEQFKKEFEKFRRKRLREKAQNLKQSLEVHKQEKSIIDKIVNQQRRRSLRETKSMLEKLFKKDADDQKN